MRKEGVCGSTFSERKMSTAKNRKSKSMVLTRTCDRMEVQLRGAVEKKR
jgi:hypothetical protein